MSLRVLVVDDHPLYPRGWWPPSPRARWSAAGDGGGGEAVREASRLVPVVVVMDLQMPGMNGIEATRRIVAEQPQTGVLVLTMLDGDDSVFAAMRAGARGYPLKGADRNEIRQALDTISRGGVVFSPGIATRVLGFFAGGGQASVTPFPDLTEREREILDLVARGLTNTQIAGRLLLSPMTVRNHVSNVFTKLQVASRAEAVAQARDAALGGNRR